jgi:hypothetical protein
LEGARWRPEKTLADMDLDGSAKSIQEGGRLSYLLAADGRDDDIADASISSYCILECSDTGSVSTMGSAVIAIGATTSCVLREMVTSSMKSSGMTATKSALG